MQIYDLLNKIELKKYKRKNKLCYFDPYRKRFLQETPEEVVRQKVACYFEKTLNVPYNMIMTEEPLVHYGVNDKGRMDIVIDQINEKENILFPLAVVECKAKNILLDERTFQQASRYADYIGADYIFLCNGVDILGWKYLEKVNKYISMDKIPTYTEMINENITYKLEKPIFIRQTMEQLKKVNMLKSDFPFYSNIIGEDTPDLIAPTIINLYECFMDYSVDFPCGQYDDINIEKDLGTQLLNYGDASGSDFGTGIYRTLMVKNHDDNYEIIRFTISNTGKCENDSKYGNRAGQSVLVVSIDNFEKDMMVVQINLNKFMTKNNNGAVISHNGATAIKGAKKENLFKEINKLYPELIKHNVVILGKLNCNNLLYMNNKCVIDLIINLIHYSNIRYRYKLSLKETNHIFKKKE